ncbi:MAG: MFS transporter [Anaerolineae bacterium]|nr:MFS transporter [Anaerolineae bacterium]
METSSQILGGKGIDRKAWIFILITTFLGSLGIGLISPVAPFMISRYVTDSNSAGLILGWLTSAYAICQFIAAPGLGALSDRFGRRPILLICLFGSAVGYLLLGIGGALWVLILGRIIDGLTGGNFSVTFAYVADLTPPDERGKYFGWLGAFAGIGIILGPAIGGLVAKLGISAPLYLAAAVTFANLLFGLFFMPESLSKAQRTPHIRITQLNPFTILSKVASMPQVRWLLLAGFMIALPMGALQGNIGLFAKDSLNWDAAAIGSIFVVVGITDILVQGLLLQRLLKHFSEKLVAIGGMAGEMIGYLLIGSTAFIHSPIPLLIGTIIFAMGDGLIGPALNGLLSRGVDANAQGQVQGGNQAAQSLARTGGPLLGGALYDRVGHGSPYFAGSAIVVLAIAVISMALPTLNRTIKPAESTSA